jgi:transposase
VPKRELRELRDLTRCRAQLVSEQTRVANRVHKVLEDANIKLGAVASDILGKSGRTMLWALNRGERDPDKLADLALGRLRAKIPELKLTLEGHFREHHQFLVEHLLGHLEDLERRIEEFSQRIAERLPSILDDERLRRLDAIAGVNRTTIENVVAEIGVDMSQFPDEHHLSSWAGICFPRSDQFSAGSPDLREPESRCPREALVLGPRHGHLDAGDEVIVVAQMEA